MRRFYRLFSPALSFAVLGGLMLYLATLPFFRMRGGLPTAGAYVFALQIASTLLLLLLIDDLKDPPTVDRDRGSRRRTGLSAGVEGNQRFSRALVAFYLSSPVAASVFAFGLSASLSLTAYGFFDERRHLGRPAANILESVRVSEVVIGGLLIVSCLAGWSIWKHGYSGWVIGACLGAVTAQSHLDPEVNVGPTAFGWAVFAGALIAVRYVFLVLKWRRVASRSAT